MLSGGKLKRGSRCRRRGYSRKAGHTVCRKYSQPRRSGRRSCSRWRRSKKSRSKKSRSKKDCASKLWKGEKAKGFKPTMKELRTIISRCKDHETQLDAEDLDRLKNDLSGKIQRAGGPGGLGGSLKELVVALAKARAESEGVVSGRSAKLNDERELVGGRRCRRSRRSRSGRRSRRYSRR